MEPSRELGMGRDSILALSLNKSSDGISDLESKIGHLNISNKDYSQFGPENFCSDHKRGVWRVCSINQNYFASASYDHVAKVCSVTEKKEIFTLSGHKKEVLSLAPIDKERLATGSSDGTIKIWNLKNGKMISEIAETKSKTGIYSLTYAEGRFLSGSCHVPKNHSKKWDHVIKVWNAEEGSFSFSMQGHSGGISKIVHLSKGTFISSSHDSTLKLWDLETKKCNGTLKAHTDWVYSLAKINANRVVSASKDRTIRLWDIEKEQSEILGDPQGSLSSHASTVYDVATYGEHILASASRDGHVKVWDLRSKKSIGIRDTTQGFVFSVDFTEDGKIIAGYSGKGEKPKEGGGTLIWDFPNNK